MVDSALNVGIDIGSTTIKVVVLNQAKEIVYKTYARHFSEIGRALHENLAALRSIVGRQRFSFALTGRSAAGRSAVRAGGHRLRVGGEVLYSADGYGGRAGRRGREDYVCRAGV